MATHSFKLEADVPKSSAMDGEVAELHADLGDLSQQPKMNAMRVDNRKIFEDELEGVVNPMMTNVCQAAGGGDDMLGGMLGGGFDDASGAGGNGHNAVLVRSVTPSCRRRSRSPARAKRSQALGSCTDASNNTNRRQCREKDGKTEKKTRKKRPRDREREEEQRGERGREENVRRREEQGVWKVRKEEVRLLRSRRVG